MSILASKSKVLLFNKSLYYSAIWTVDSSLGKYSKKSSQFCRENINPVTVLCINHSYNMWNGVPNTLDSNRIINILISLSHFQAQSSSIGLHIP